MKIIKGDLIKLTQEGQFDVICHGCNCQNKMGSGIAKQLETAFPSVFTTDKIHMNSSEFQRINKLGTISFYTDHLNGKNVNIVNCYTQYNYGTDRMHLNYSALRLCLQKINQCFGGEGVKIGLPKIGCGLAGGDWNIVKNIIEEDLKDFDITVVEY